MRVDLTDVPIGEVTAPVWLTIGDPNAGALPALLGEVRVAMHVDQDEHGAYRAVSSDPDAVRATVAALLEQQAKTLRNTVEGEEVPDAAPSA